MKKILFILVIGISEIFGYSISDVSVYRNDEVSCTWVYDNFQIKFERMPASVYADFEKNKDNYSCHEIKEKHNYREVRKIIAVSPDSSKFFGISYKNEKEMASIACFADNRKLTVDHIFHLGSEERFGDNYRVIYKEKLFGETSLNSETFSDYIYPPPRKIPVTVCNRFKWDGNLIDYVYIGKMSSFLAKIIVRELLQQLDGGV